MGTTAEKLNKLKATKTAIKQAIIDKGVAVADSDTFATYPEKISAIQSGGGNDELVNILTGDFLGNEVFKLPKPKNGNVLILRENALSYNHNIHKIMQVSNDFAVHIAPRCFSSSFDLIEIDIILDGNYADTNSTCYYCSKLKKVSFKNPNSAIIDFNNSTFRSCPKLEELVCENVRTCGSQSFYGTVSLDSSKLLFLNSVETIGQYAFEIEYFNLGKDTKFTSISLPNVKTIGSSAFSSRNNMTSFHIGNKIERIEPCFYGCDNLKTITIDKPQDSISGAPWGAPNATVVWNG